MPVTIAVVSIRKGAKGAPGSDARVPPSVSFDGPRIAIGRSSACEVRLPDTTVSSRHASIRAQSPGWVVVDEGSTNGTHLNDERLTPRAPRSIKSGDLVRVGRVTLSIRIGAAPTSNGHATRDLAIALVQAAIEERALGAGAWGKDGKRTPTLTVHEGVDAGQSMALEDGVPVSIGRDPRCTMRLTDRLIGAWVVEVVHRDGRISVERHDERGACLLGERELVVGVATAWTTKQPLVVGDTSILLDDPIARALDESENGDDVAFVEALDDDAPIAPLPAVVPAAAAPASDAAEGVAAGSGDTAAPVAPAARAERPTYDRRRSWRGASNAFEIVVLIVAVAVLVGSVLGLYGLLRK